VCPLPSYAVGQSGVFPVGAEHPRKAPVFREVFGKCRESLRPPGHRLFTVGAEVAPANFVAFTKQTSAPTVLPRSGSRIVVTREQYVGADGSIATVKTHYRDEKLNTECHIRPASDGVARCLPTTHVVFSNFVDAGCTTPLAVIFNPTAPVPRYAVEPERFSTKGARNDLPVHKVIRIGTDYPAPAPLFGGSPGSCYKATRGPEYRYFKVGAETAPTDFVALANEAP
jgi:hypothetical protein